MFVLQGATYVLPLITVPYLVRVLGPADFGRMAFSQAFIAYFGMLVDYGFNLSATRQVALIRQDAARLSRLVAAVMTIKIVLAAIGFVLVCAIAGLIPRFGADRLLFICTYTSVIGNVVFPVWLYRGLEAMKLLSILTIAGRALSVIGIFVFVHGQKDLLAAVLLQSGALVLSGVPALTILPRLAPLRLDFPRLGEVWKTLIDGWHAFLTTSAITLYTSTNMFVVGLMAPPISVGYYAAASKLIGAVSGLVSPVSQAVYPHIVGLAAKSRERALEFIGRLLWLQGGATLLLSLVLFGLAGFLVQLSLGPQFAPAVVMVRIMAPLPFIIGLSNVFGIQTMMAFDMKKVCSRIIAGCGLLNLAILFPLVWWVGAAGAAYSVLAVEVAVTSAMALVLRRNGILAGIMSSGAPAKIPA